MGTLRYGAFSAFMLLLAGTAAAEPALQTLAIIGGQIYGGLLFGPNGEIYGPTEYGGQGRGSVWKLVPPASRGGTWTQVTLHSFNGLDGGHPQSALIMGKSGVLYGSAGAGTLHNGLVFSLSPPQTPGDAWGEKVLYTFTGQNGDGIGPGGLSFGPHGEIYGTTYGGGAFGLGTVFELAPPAAPGGVWTETVIYTFGSLPNDGGAPAAPLLVANDGTLYGTTSGTVFEMTPPSQPGGAWTLATLCAAPAGGSAGASLIMDSSGNLYSTSNGSGSCTGAGGCGAVFELTPPAVAGGAWTETTLYSFTGQNGDGYFPTGGVLLAKDGRLYGTTVFGGLVSNPLGTFFWLTPPVTPGGVWTETVLPISRQSGNATPFASLSSYNGVIYGAGVDSVFELKAQ